MLAVILKPKSIVALLAMLAAIVAVACGASATATPVAAPVPTTAASSAVATPVPTEVTQPSVGKAKVDRLVMGLISPTRDYFRTWQLGSADQLIKQDPMQEWLFEIDPLTQSFGPWLADSFELAPDSRSWNLKLAKGAVWHSKTGMDYGEYGAEDLLHNWNIWCNPDYPGRETDPSSGYKVGMCQVERVEIIDNNEVIMHCSVPCPDLLFYYSQATDIVQFSKRQWDEEGEGSYETHVAGTGPYIFQEHKLGESVLYSRAPGTHWKRGIVDWEELIMTWVLEEATRMAQFVAGETHLTEVNKDLTDQLVSRGFKLVKSTGPAQQVQINFTGLYFGTEDESRDKYVGTTGKLDPDLPFTNIKVRQAINKAIDRESIKQELYKGRVTSQYVHGYYDGLPGYDPTWADRFEEAYGYDVERAKELMAEAGYANGFTAKAFLFPFPGAPELIPLMEAVQIYLSEIGIDLTLEEADWAGVVIPKLRSRDFPGYMYAIPPSKKAVESQVGAFNGGYNVIHQYETDEIWDIWDKLRNTADLDERDVILREIGNIKFNNFENVPLYEVFIEVILDPNIVDDWIFPGWDGGDIGHTWNITACKQVNPCR